MQVHVHLTAAQFRKPLPRQGTARPLDGMSLPQRAVSPIISAVQVGIKL